MKTPPDAVTTTYALTPEIELTGEQLRRALRPIVEEAGGQPPRTGRLGRRLGIDKSLASRLVRALSGESNLELVHRIPSPTGLRMVLESARRAGIAAPLIAAAEVEVERLDAFFHATPGGKDAIDAHISESSQEVREARENSSKQAVYKAMSFLLGYYCEALTSTLILLPAKNGRTVDGVEVHQRVGMRRLRPHTPLALLSILTPPEEVPPGDTTWIEPLDGGLGKAEAAKFLWNEFSTDPIPKLEIVEEGGHTTFVLEDVKRLLNHPMSLTSVLRIRNGWPRSQSDGLRNGSRGYVLHMPAKMLVRDLFIAEDVYPGAVPDLTFQLQNPAGRTGRRPQGLSARISSLDLHAPIEQLRPGPRGFAVAGLTRYRDIVAHVFARIDQDPTRFRGYRCAITYPVPLIEMAWWWPLPSA